MRKWIARSAVDAGRQLHGCHFADHHGVGRFAHLDLHSQAQRLFAGRRAIVRLATPASAAPNAWPEPHSDVAAQHAQWVSVDVFN